MILIFVSPKEKPRKMSLELCRVDLSHFSVSRASLLSPIVPIYAPESDLERSERENGIKSTMRFWHEAGEGHRFEVLHAWEAHPCFCILNF